MANFCEHCAGQRFDRAQVLRTLRHVRRDLRGRQCGADVEDAIMLVLKTIARLDLPHLDIDDVGSDVVH